MLPNAANFDLDEIYVNDGCQITKVEEYQPKRFIALTWWTNKIYLFQRGDKNVKTVEPTFGINL